MFQVFARSFKGLNLSPGERALMKLIEGWLITALLAGSAIAYQLLMSGSADYVFIARSAGGAALLALLLAFKKYLAAQSDLPLSVASLAGQAADVALMEVKKFVPWPGEQPADTPAPQFTTPVPQPPYQAQAQFAPPMNPMYSPTNSGMVTLSAPAQQPSTTYVSPVMQYPPVSRHFGDTSVVPVPPQ
jgi:hypothetical protein